MKDDFGVKKTKSQVCKEFNLNALIDDDERHLKDTKKYILKDNDKETSKNFYLYYEMIEKEVKNDFLPIKLIFNENKIKIPYLSQKFNISDYNFLLESMPYGSYENNDTNYLTMPFILTPSILKTFIRGCDIDYIDIIERKIKERDNISPHIYFSFCIVGILLNFNIKINKLFEKNKLIEFSIIENNSEQCREIIHYYLKVRFHIQQLLSKYQIFFG
jgi:hypothetical protein